MDSNAASKHPLRGGYGERIPTLACCVDKSAADLSPAASRICTTSVLPNKAASCKALPISVWKANESAEQDVIRTVWRGFPWQMGHGWEGTGKENKPQSPLSLSFQFFVYGFQNHNCGMYLKVVCMPPAGHMWINEQVLLEPPTGENPRKSTFVSGRNNGKQAQVKKITFTANVLQCMQNLRNPSSQWAKQWRKRLGVLLATSHWWDSGASW